MEVYDLSERLLALAPWIVLACIYIFFKICTRTNGSSPEPVIYSGPRHEFAVVVDPSGSVQVGVRNVRSSNMLKSPSGGDSLSAQGDDTEENDIFPVSSSNSQTQNGTTVGNIVM